MKVYVASLFMIFVFLTSCTMQSSKVVTMHTYLKVENGESREDLVTQFGKPKSIEINDDGGEVYTYIEQLSINGEIVEMRYYYFFIRDDKVYRKLVRVEDRPAMIDMDRY